MKLIHLSDLHLGKRVNEFHDRRSEIYFERNPENH